MECNVFPTSIFDNFYDDPDSVREYALSLEYRNWRGTYPGLRSKPLPEINKGFWQRSYHKVLSMFGDYYHTEDDTNYTVDSCFQKISRFSSDPEDPVNAGYIHNDEPADLAAVVYLDKDPFINNGTSLYVKDNPSSLLLSEIKHKRRVAESVLGVSETSNIDDIQKYRESIIENNKQYTLTVEVKNCYNRMIAYSGNQWHSQTNYYMPSDEDFRLTQVFFFYDMKLPIELIPQNRCNRYGI